MSEHLTPDQQRFATQNLLRDAEWVAKGAKIGRAGSLIVTATQQEEAEQLRAADATHANMPETGTETPTATPEKPVQETLSEIAKESGVVFNMWTQSGAFEEGNVRFLRLLSGAAKKLGPDNRYSGGHRKNGDERGNMAEAYLEQASTPLELYRRLNADGVSEVVSFTDLDDTMAGRHSNTTASQWLEYTGLDDAALVTYELTNSKTGSDDYTRYSAKNKYKMGTGSDEMLKYQMVMSRDNARQLESMIKADPEVLHQLTDTVATEVLGGKIDAWQKGGPQYDQWRELSEDGKNRMAIRHDITNPDGPTEIIAY